MTRSSGHIRRWCTVLLLTISMVAAACGGDDDDASGTDETGEAETGALDESSDEPELIDPADEVGTPVAGGTLAVGLDSEVDGLNPTNNAFDVSGLQMGITVFDTLAVHNEDNEPVPFLAESLTPNEDFTEWTVRLREGVTFQDGEPLNAAAVEAAFAATLSSPLVSLALLPIMDPDDATEVVGLSPSRAEGVCRVSHPGATVPQCFRGDRGLTSKDAGHAILGANFVHTFRSTPWGIRDPFVPSHLALAHGAAAVRLDDRCRVRRGR